MTITMWEAEYPMGSPAVGGKNAPMRERGGRAWKTILQKR